jgi:hypothetical protein
MVSTEPPAERLQREGREGEARLRYRVRLGKDKPTDSVQVRLPGAQAVVFEPEMTATFVEKPASVAPPSAAVTPALSQ